MVEDAEAADVEARELAFERMDLDSNGVVDADELAASIVSAMVAERAAEGGTGAGVQEEAQEEALEEATAMLASADADANGVISLAELMATPTEGVPAVLQPLLSPAALTN